MTRLIQMGLRMKNGDEGICESIEESKHITTMLKSNKLNAYVYKHHP